MMTKKQMQLAELIRRHFSDVLREEGYYIYGATPLVTVTQVQLSPDMSYCTIYLSIYNADKKAVFQAIEDNTWKLKQSLVAKIRHKLRRMPELRFRLDETLDEWQKAEQLVKKYIDGQSDSVPDTE